MDASAVPGKRVRKKSKRLSESEEPVKKKRRLRSEGLDTAATGESAKKKRERGRERSRKLVVSLNFARSNLRLSNVSQTQSKGALSNRSDDTPTPCSSTNGEGAIGRRNTEMRFKNPDFTVSGTSP